MSSVALPEATGAVFDECRELARRFTEVGHRLYLVGGIVRDLFVDRADAERDFDFTTDATPAQVKAILGPYADAVWTQGERFGTIAAKIDGRLVEITTHRAEAYDPDSRKPRVAFSTDLTDDLSRRDFTINALALEVTADEPVLIDPFSGLGDLTARRLVTPRSATESFSDDPLRMMRAARFIARLGMVPEPDIRAAIVELGQRIGVVSAERIRDEIEKLLVIDDPTAGLQFLVETGIAGRVFPELEPSWQEPARIAPGGSSLLIERLSVVFLASDPSSARRRLRALRTSRQLCDDVATVVELAEVIGAHTGEWSDSDVRRILHRAGDRLTAATSVAGANSSGRAAAIALRLRCDALAAREAVDTLIAPLDGDEVMALLGVAPGPEVGRALGYLLDLRLDLGPLDHDTAVELLRGWWAEQRSPGSN